MYKRRIENPEIVSSFSPPVFEDSLRAVQRLEDIERDAYERGFNQGKRAGLEMAEKEAGLIISRLEDLIAQFIAFREEMERNIKPWILELSVSIARKIIMKEIETDSEIVLRLTEEAIKKIERQGQLKIKINPLLKDLLEKASPGLLRLHQDIVIDIDPSMPPYGSEIVSETQEIITDIDEQIKTLISDLAERL